MLGLSMFQQEETVTGKGRSDVLAEVMIRNQK